MQVLAPVMRWDRQEGWQPRAPVPPLVVTSQPGIDILYAGRGDEVVEGEPAEVVWQWAGDIVSVRIFCEYEVCQLGGRSRGRERKLLAGPIPNSGYAVWTPEWLDAPGFTLRLVGYGATGEPAASAEKYVTLRPKEARDLDGTFILILRHRQRLYFFQDDKLRRMHVVSTGRRGYATPRMMPGMVRRGVRMGQVFYKDAQAWSRRYNCPMPYWMAVTSSGSHGIHATVPRAYRLLGRVASHGCIRQHLHDARILFGMVKVGTPVYIF
ncbi:MAG: L,D-transpeptidase [Armatimonadetes bacterium]|nr:L,D-transpeptidase [Armatimonadota bacterium]